MTNEKLNKLRNAINKAGNCDIVRVAVGGYTITNFILMGDLTIDKDTSHAYVKVCVSKACNLNELVWIEDHPGLSYEFVCEVSGENPKTVTYCNGKIKTVKR